MVLGNGERDVEPTNAHSFLSPKNCPPRAICTAVGASVLEVVVTAQIITMLREHCQIYPVNAVQQLAASLISTHQLTTSLDERRRLSNTSPFIIRDTRELADKIKATLGAIYLTQGIAAARLFVSKLLETPFRRMEERLNKLDGADSSPPFINTAHLTRSPVQSVNQYSKNPATAEAPASLPEGFIDRITESAHDIYSIVSAKANNHRILLSLHLTSRMRNPYENILGTLVFNLCFMTRSVQLLSSMAPNDEGVKHEFAKKVLDAAKSRFDQGFLSFCPFAYVSKADIDCLKRDGGTLDRIILGTLFAELYRTGNLSAGVEILSHDRALDPVWIRLLDLTPNRKMNPWTPFKDLFEKPEISQHLPVQATPCLSDEEYRTEERSARALKYAARQREGHSVTRDERMEIQAARERGLFEDTELARAERFESRGTLKRPILPKSAKKSRKKKAYHSAVVKAQEEMCATDQKPESDFGLLWSS